MPPALVITLLAGILVPTGLRSLTGRPRHLAAACVAAITAALGGQVIGEIVGGRALVLGDAQLGISLVASLAATLIVSVIERRSLG